MPERFGGQGFGNVGLGIGGEPSPTRTRPDLCGSFGHPPCTYNPWSYETWCLCGRTREVGDATSVPHVACCGGVLEERVLPPGLPSPPATPTPAADVTSEGEAP